MMLTAPRAVANARRQISILHVLEATLGGTLRYLHDIVDASTDMPFSMGWVYSTGRAGSGLVPALKRARSSDWQLFNLEMTRSISPASDIRNALKLRTILHSYRPDIVHCHSSKAGALGRLALFGLHRGPKLVYSPHGVSARLGTKYALIERGLSGLTDRFSAVSDSERQEIVDYGIARKTRIDVVYPAIDTYHFRPTPQMEGRRQLGIPTGVPLILGVGRLTSDKDPFAFVEVVQHLLPAVPELTAIWVGDGELRSQMEETLRSKRLSERIRITGWQDDVRPYLAACDLLVSTSRCESFGYMVAEALAMERPVVASHVIGTVDIMRKDLTSLLYPSNDHAMAASLAAELLANPIRARALGAIGRRLVMENFSRSRMTKALQDCYGHLLQDGAGN